MIDVCLQEERQQVSFHDIKKIYASITKEAKQLYEAKQMRNAFAKYKRVSDWLNSQ